jgi:hypothetical protein
MFVCEVKVIGVLGYLKKHLDYAYAYAVDINNALQNANVRRIAANNLVYVD